MRDLILIAMRDGLPKREIISSSEASQHGLRAFGPKRRYIPCRGCEAPATVVSALSGLFSATDYSATSTQGGPSAGN